MGVAKGGSATLIIVLVLLLAGCIAGGIYWYNKSQAPDVSEKDNDYQNAEKAAEEEE